MQNDKSTNKWLTTNKIILICGVLTIVSPYILTLRLGLISFENTGQIGDTIGGITSPIIGLLGAYLVYRALQAQIDANEELRIQFQAQQKATASAFALQLQSNHLVEKQFKQQLIEAEAQKKLFEEQKLLSLRQNFESSLFHLIGVHHGIIERMSLDVLLVTETLNQYLSPEKSDFLHEKYVQKKNTEIKSLNVLKITANLFIDFMKIPYEQLSQESAYLIKYESVKHKKQIYPYSYKTTYKLFIGELETNLGVYFGSLLLIFEMIDSQQFYVAHQYSKEFETKYYYTSIIRAQLSKHELIWLFFAGLNDNRLKKMIEKYGLLEALEDSTKPEIEIMKYLYKESAYKKYNSWTVSNRNNPKK